MQQTVKKTRFLFLFSENAHHFVIFAKIKNRMNYLFIMKIIYVL